MAALCAMSNFIGDCWYPWQKVSGLLSLSAPINLLGSQKVSVGFFLDFTSTIPNCWMNLCSNKAPAITICWSPSWQHFVCSHLPCASACDSDILVNYCLGTWEELPSILFRSATWRWFPPAFLNTPNIWTEKAQMSIEETLTHLLEFLANQRLTLLCSLRFR